MVMVIVTLIGAVYGAAIVELPLRDVALRVLPARPAAHATVVAIDERSLREVGPWPWPRATLAALIGRIRGAGARAVVLDVLLADPRAGDAQLVAAMRRMPTVVVCVLVEGQRWILPAPAIGEAGIVAHGNFELDRDGILRRFASTKQSDDRAYTALSLEAASFIRDTPVPVGRSIALMFRTTPRAIPVVSAVDVLRGSAAALKGRVVFVGPTALGLGDRVLTPVSTTSHPDPGVTVHAASTESLLRGEEVRDLPPIAAGVLTGLAVGAIVQTRRRSRRVRLSLAAALLVLALAGGEAMLAIVGVAVPFATLAGAIALTAAFVETNVMSASLRKSRVDILRLEEIATDIAAHRAEEIESKQVLAHELRTPLASMRSLTQLLAGYELTEGERRRVTSLLQTEAGKLEAMVNALLDLERLALRDYHSSSAVLDLGELVGARVAFLSASAGRPLGWTGAPGVLVRADAMLIERVVDNLVSNALKYTPSSAPVHVTVHRANGDAVLEVEDRGRGIAPSERELIFRRFARGSTARGTEGLGLGLSLVAEVTRWHGGRVRVEAVPEGGSRFVVILPAQEG
jgi:signal transduction histidine kinase